MKKIGRSEKVYFPKLNECVITAKIDTGAFDCLLHVDSVKIIDSGLQVKISNNTYIFHKWSEVDVKSSNGKSQKRYGVKLKMQLGQKKYRIFVSLTNRKDMKFSLLIGRRFLYSNNFLVDVKKKNIHVELKKYNYFTGDVSSVASGVSTIVNFLDFTGHNYILFTPPKPSDSNKFYDLCLYHHLNNKIEFENLQDFTEKILNKSNLFRVDIIVFDFWSKKRINWEPYINVIKELSQKFIIVSKEFQYKSTDDVNDFLLRSEYKELHKHDTWLTDKISGSTATIDSLKKSYIRDKKLENLFGGE